jgi:hypothetical protein
MNRREFLEGAGAACCHGAARRLPPLAGAWLQSGAPNADPIILRLVSANDDRVRQYLLRQERRRGHRWLGGIPNEYGIHTAGETAGFVSALACASAAPESAFFRSEALVEPLRLAIGYLRKAQHDDGTVDLHSTNFHSPPDTAFVLELLCPVAVILNALRWRPHEELLSELGRFIVKGGEALDTGGIHTPNHRWVVSSALARVHALFPDRRHVARIDQWLDEGIDVDPDGQFAERSTSVYSPIVDRCLLTVARLLERPALNEPVRRNLDMTLYYVHPDGEVVTEGSLRQDRYQRASMIRYYYPYRRLALVDGDGRFAAMARRIEAAAGAGLAGELASFLEEPGHGRPMPAGAPLPADYAKVFSHSGVARIRRGDISATILAGNATFFTFRNGSAVLEACRVAAAFFGKGQFAGERLEVVDGRFVLRQSLEGPYFQPVAKDRVTDGAAVVRTEPNGTLRVTPQAERARSNVQVLEMVVELEETAGAFGVSIAITGTDHVPVAVELAFRREGHLTGVEAAPGTSETYLLKDGMGTFAHEGRVITFGPGRAEHTWTALRGGATRWDGQSVYLTGFTPFRHTVRIG